LRNILKCGALIEEKDKRCWSCNVSFDEEIEKREEEEEKRYKKKKEIKVLEELQKEDFKEDHFNKQL